MPRSQDLYRHPVDDDDDDDGGGDDDDDYGNRRNKDKNNFIQLTRN